MILTIKQFVDKVKDLPYIAPDGEVLCETWGAERAYKLAKKYDNDDSIISLGSIYLDIICAIEGDEEEE